MSPARCRSSPTEPSIYASAYLPGLGILYAGQGPRGGAASEPPAPEIAEPVQAEPRSESHNEARKVSEVALAAAGHSQAGGSRQAGVGPAPFQPPIRPCPRSQARSDGQAGSICRVAFSKWCAAHERDALGSERSEEHQWQRKRRPCRNKFGETYRIKRRPHRPGTGSPRLAGASPAAPAKHKATPMASRQRPRPPRPSGPSPGAMHARCAAAAESRL